MTVAIVFSCFMTAVVSPQILMDDVLIALEDSEEADLSVSRDGNGK